MNRAWDIFKIGLGADRKRGQNFLRRSEACLSTVYGRQVAYGDGRPPAGRSEPRDLFPSWTGFRRGGSGPGPANLVFVDTAPLASVCAKNKELGAARQRPACSSVVDIFMSLPGQRGGSCGRKRPLEAPHEEGAAAASPPTNFPRFEPPPAPTTGAESNTNGDRDPYGEDSDIFDEAHLPNDTMATVLALQKEFYHGDGKNSAPGSRPSGERTGVVLQHQM